MTKNKAASPKPLTAPPAPDLDWSREGAPASGSFNDIYFSVDGGLAETKAVFLKACGLPERWQERPVFVIGELGFGSGLNFLAAWDLWTKTAAANQHLHFISVEAYPWTAGDLRKALAAWPELAPLTAQLIAAWPGRVRGLHRLHFGNVTLTLFHTDVDDALTGMDARVDAWFLDGFSPSKNPDMWSDSVFAQLARLSNSGAQIGTFTVAGHVRSGLAQAGFTVSKKPGFGRKRERLEAVFPDTAVLQAQSTYPPIILGGGIAGASIANSFARRGIAPVLIDPEPELNSAASGNPAGLVMPRLDLQDRPESRFFLSAYLYALSAYKQSNAVQQSGTVQLAQTQKELTRFDKLAAQAPLPPSHMARISRTEAIAICGLNLCEGHGGLYFPYAQTIDPQAVIAAWTKPCTHIADNAAHIKNQDGLWHVLNSHGETLAVSDNVFVTVGANVLDLADLDVRFTRGQICWGQSETPPKCALTYGGYALPFDGGVLLGATHEHVGGGQKQATKPEDTQENIEQFFSLSGQSISEGDAGVRAAIRVTTKNTLPIAASIAPGLNVISGLGSRGMMMAPLLGEALVSAALGAPSPLDKQTLMRFNTPP